MTKEDIGDVLNAIDCCECGRCSSCSYVEFHKCKNILFRNVRELLKKQQAKIDELIKEASGYAELLIKNEIIKDGEQE